MKADCKEKTQAHSLDKKIHSILHTLLTSDASAIFFASLFLAFISAIKVQLPFTAIPLTGQTVGIMLISCIMSRKMAICTVLTYLLEGALGLPVFAGGVGGVHIFFGPTGGYLIGFFFQALCISWMLEKVRKRTSWRLFFILLGSTLLQLTIGTLFLCSYFSLEKAFQIGFAPFILGDIIKTAAVSISVSIHEKLSRI